MVSSFGPQMQVGRLVEDDRLLRDRHAGFRGVVGVVEADGDEVAHVADAGAEPRLAGDGFSRLRLAFLILARPPEASISPSMSFTMRDRSRILPSSSMMPGFSRPGAP